jgi:alcohol dehydrogenase
MRRASLLLTAPRRLEWVLEEMAPPTGDEILVATTSGAISVGSELPIYRGAARSAAPVAYPRMTGYESVGRVIACGSAVERLKVGARVVAFYGHRSLALVPTARAIPVPDDISDALALLAILTCDVTKGIRKLAPGPDEPDEPALVTGAGAIGLLTVAMLRAYGVRVVDVVEPQAYRRALALELGARMAVDAGGRSDLGADYAAGFECSSRDEAFALLQERVRADGGICILADGNVEPLTLAPAFHAKELRVVGSSDGWDYHEHAHWYFAYLREHHPPLDTLFDRTVHSADLPATFARMASGVLEAVKVLVRYAEGTE